MLLGGLWHGASWTFVVWGALHGTYLCVEKLIQERFAGNQPKMAVGMVVEASLAPALVKNKTFNHFLLALFTFFLVNVTWVFFRATDFTTAWRMLSSMFGQTKQGIALLPTLDIIKVSVVISLMVVLHWLMRNTSVLQVTYKTRWWGIAGIWALLVIALIVSQKSGDSFIYFQF
jgi:D-alanyl-lipoteichoic acid acyltransferase DltB (MBOAT superfamily)